MLIIVFLFLGMIYTVDENKFKLIFEAQLKSATGANVKLEGPMHVNFIPSPKLEFDNVTVVGDVGKGKSIRCHIKKISLALPWHSFGGQLKEIRDLKAQSILISLDNDKSEQSLYLDQFEGDIITSYAAFELKPFKITLGKNALSGNLSYEMTEKGSILKGDVQALAWQSVLLSKQLVQNKPLAKKVLQDPWLKQMQATVTITIVDLQLKDKQVRNAHFVLTLKNNLLELKGHTPVLAN